jgi:hypothetical protein
MDKSYELKLTDNEWSLLLRAFLSGIHVNLLLLESTSDVLIITFRITFCPCDLFMSGKCDVTVYGPKDKKQSKNCFYVTEWGCVVYVWQENDKIMYLACLAGKNTFTRLKVCNSNPLRNSLLVTEHTSPSGSAIVRSITTGMPLCEWSTRLGALSIQKITATSQTRF